MKKQKLAASVALLAGGVLALPAVAQTIEIPDLDIDVYGQVNLAVMQADNGQDSGYFLVDNDYSSSRIGAIISSDVKDLGIKLGAHLEMEYQRNASNVVTPDDRNVNGEFNERHINVFASGDFGKVSVGLGAGAADGKTEVDLSGTKVVSFPDLTLVGGALRFVDETAGASTSLRSTLQSQDFESRYDRVRYDSPKLGPVSLSVSQGFKDDTNGSNDVTEVAAGFSVPLAGTLSAGVGYAIEKVGGVTGDSTTLGGSVSWLHDSGFNVSAAYSRGEDDNAANPESDFNIVKLGYKSGKHAVAIHRAEGKDFAVEGDDAEAYGVGYVYTPVKWMELYAGFNNYSLDRDGADFDDVNVALAGTRLKF